MRESKPHAFAFANPVFLHQLDAFGPARQTVFDVAEQLFGIGRYLEVIARNLALFNHSARSPAFAVNHLLIGQYGLVNRIPVHDLGLAVSNAFFKHFKKQPLVPFVIGGIASRDLAAPVNCQPHRLHLLFHVSDVVVGPLCGWHTVFHGRVFSRQTKRVPAHGHQHVVALHAQIAREHVVDGVVTDMAHVQLATGVRQHRTSVELAFGLFRVCLVFDAVSVAGSPVGLRIALNVEVVVFVLHWNKKAEGNKTGRQPIATESKRF